MNIKETVLRFVPYNDQEKADQITILEYIKLLPQLYDRNCIGHITCSPWIINSENTKVLLVYHNIYDSWGWCGGHSDGQQDLLKTALKEGLEETGLSNLTPISRDIFSIEVLPVPAHYKNGVFISSHIHLNFTFLCIADEKDSLHCKLDENSGVMWVEKEHIDSYIQEMQMLPIYHKLIEKSKRLHK